MFFYYIFIFIHWIYDKLDEDTKKWTFFKIIWMFIIIFVSQNNPYVKVFFNRPSATFWYPDLDWGAYMLKLVGTKVSQGKKEYVDVVMAQWLWMRLMWCSTVQNVVQSDIFFKSIHINNPNVLRSSLPQFKMADLW